MPIDLPSDIITKPAAALRESMARVKFIDSAIEDDPIKAGLEARTAETLGKEAQSTTRRGHGRK